MTRLLCTLTVAVVVALTPRSTCAQSLSAADLRSATRACHAGTGDLAACARVGRHHLAQHERADGDRGVAALSSACEHGGGEACRALAQVYETGWPDVHHQLIPRDLGRAHDLAISGCTAGDMASCAIAERVGAAPHADTLQSVADIAQTFDATLTADALRARCAELHGVLNEVARPDHTRVVECNVRRYLGNQLGGEVHARVTGTTHEVTEVLVEASVHGVLPSVSSRTADPVAAQLGQILLAVYQPRFGLGLDPASPSWTHRYRPATPNGVTVEVGSSSFSISYDPRVTTP